MRFVFLILFLMSCSSVPIFDAEWCGDMGNLGASCFHTLTEESRDIEKAEWDAERFGQLCTKPQTFRDIKASIEKLCSASTVRCTYEIREVIRHMAEKIDEVEKLMEKNRAYAAAQ